ncbi:hypothetical protein JHK86_050434 [Glycine max]|nr:hypothetical protein JHK86_050434 [Glycine max]
MGWKRIENGLRKVTKDEGGSLKKRVQEMKEKAHKVVQEGGSSYDTVSLPIEYYDAKVLHASEDRIGKMVRVDQNTLTQERGKFGMWRDVLTKENQTHGKESTTIKGMGINKQTEEQYRPFEGL